MPPSAAEIVRAAVAAWNSGDWDECFANAAPEIELDNSTVEGEYRGVHRGPDEGKLMFRKFVEPWKSVQVEVAKLIEAGDQVFTRIKGHFQGRGGIEVETETGMCWSFHEGKLTRVYMPNEVDEARRAAGLPLS